MADGSASASASKRVRYKIGTVAKGSHAIDVMDPAEPGDLIWAVKKKNPKHRIAGENDVDIIVRHWMHADKTPVDVNGNFPEVEGDAVLQAGNYYIIELPPTEDEGGPSGGQLVYRRKNVVDVTTGAFSKQVAEGQVEKYVFHSGGLVHHVPTPDKDKLPLKKIYGTFDASVFFRTDAIATNEVTKLMQEAAAGLGNDKSDDVRAHAQSVVWLCAQWLLHNTNTGLATPTESAVYHVHYNNIITIPAALVLLEEEFEWTPERLSPYVCRWPIDNKNVQIHMKTDGSLVHLNGLVLFNMEGKLSGDKDMKKLCFLMSDALLSLWECLEKKEDRQAAAVFGAYFDQSRITFLRATVPPGREPTGVSADFVFHSRAFDKGERVKATACMFSIVCEIAATAKKPMRRVRMPPAPHHIAATHSKKSSHPGVQTAGRAEMLLEHNNANTLAITENGVSFDVLYAHNAAMAKEEQLEQDEAHRRIRKGKYKGKKAIVKEIPRRDGREIVALRRAADLPGVVDILTIVNLPYRERKAIVLPEHTTMLGFVRDCKKASLVPMFGEVAQIIKDLAKRGIAHGDIKPSNIVVNEYGHAVLIDFDLCVMVNPGEDILTTNGAGSDHYMAPEKMVSPCLEHDAVKADIYSLGATFTALLGEPDNSDDDKVKAVRELAKKCTNVTPEERPTLDDLMIVARPLGWDDHETQRVAKRPRLK